MSIVDHDLNENGKITFDVWIFQNSVFGKVSTYAHIFLFADAYVA